MRVKKSEDSKVNKIIRKVEESAAPHSAAEAIEEKISQKRNPGELTGAIVILALMGLSLVQSIELISLRNQLKNGQFGANNAGAPATGGAQGLPAQQGGC